MRLGDLDPPKSAKVVVGESRFSFQLWWEISPFLEARPSSKKKSNFSHNGKDDEEARAGGRVSLSGQVMQKAAGAADATGVTGDVTEKAHVLSNQTKSWSPGLLACR